MIHVNVDVTNPGQFFACCGLLELADRLWPGAEGRFEGRNFVIAGSGVEAAALLDGLTRCELRNTMTPGQRSRRDELNAKSKLSPGEEVELKRLDSLMREEPLVFGDPFCFRTDWWHDDRAGGSRFKTWAGQQSVLDIGTKMKVPLAGLDDPETWFTYRASGAVPFFFDSDAGASSAVDVGFSPDPLKVGASFRPLVELAAFVGLQRFRPRPAGDNLYEYVTWGEALPPELAAVAACGLMPIRGQAFYFRLLFRTKYLKSFLPATAMGDVR